MKKAPAIKNEKERLQKLRNYEVLDTPPSNDFDYITRVAARICDCKISLVSLVDEHRQWFKSRHGLDASETPRDISYCGHAIEGKEVFIVEDASQDERFCDNPLLLGEPHVRFYAGAPLVTSDGYRIGTLCVIDSMPKKLNQVQVETLVDLSKLVIEVLDTKIVNRELDALKRQYEDVQSMSQTGGWELDLETQKTKWSKEIYKIHGVPEGDSLDKVDAISFYAPHERDRLLANIERCQSEGIAYDDEFEFYDQNGKHKWVRAAGKA